MIHEIWGKTTGSTFVNSLKLVHAISKGKILTQMVILTTWESTLNYTD